MSEANRIDWTKTSFEGSRREQLRRWRSLSLRERLEELDRLTACALRIQQASRDARAREVREQGLPYSPGGSGHEIVLQGCNPTPLASYLKALAVLRLVAEQGGDPDAAGFWRDDEFVLRSSLDREALLNFFLESYRPTPIISPWNGGSGFYYQEGKLEQKDPATGKKLKTGIRDQPTESTRALEAIEKSTTERLGVYRKVIRKAREVVTRFKIDKAPEQDFKDKFISDLRNIETEEALQWIDAAIVLADGGPKYPPLLGTGGNDGNLDFTANFMQRLADLFDFATGLSREGVPELLDAALFATPTAALPAQTIGQFSPGDAGGPNATAGFEGEARVNPWNFVLMLEGAVLLAASAVRRLESSSAAVLSAPFTVRSRAATVGGAAGGDDADARGEIWMPLWAKPCSLPELSALFSEGRAALGTRPAQDGLDFARAVAKLGVERGIKEFQRYGFLMRSGKAFLATPLARVPVCRNARADLIDDLDRHDWLARVQRYARDDKAPNAFRSQAMQLDAALFALTQRADRVAIDRVLRLLGRIEALASTSPKVREQIAPVPPLSAAWALNADDGSAEFRIALALAGLALLRAGDGNAVRLGFRPHLALLRPDGRAWDKDSRLACWGPGPLARNLAALLHRRRLEAVRLGLEGEILASRTGARRDDVSLFLLGRTDDRRIAELAHGLACVERLDLVGTQPTSPSMAPPPAYALLKPFFASDALLRRVGWLAPEVSLRLPAEMPLRLAADDVDAALRLAWQRLRALGKQLPGRNPPQFPRSGDGPRLLAALVIPLAPRELVRLLDDLDLDSDEDPSASVANLD